MILSDNPLADLTPLYSVASLGYIEIAAIDSAAHFPEMIDSLRSLGIVFQILPTTGDPENAQTEAPTFETLIPDPVLRIFIEFQFDASEGPPVIDAESLLGITRLETAPLVRYLDDGTDTLHIGDLSGIGRLRNLTQLVLYDFHVSDLSPLIDLTKLETLQVSLSPVVRLDPLRSLSQLRILSIVGTAVEDITPLAELHRITDLDLFSNQITDISALSGLTEMDDLSLANNHIEDLTPLTAMAKLRWLDVGGNRIEDIGPLLGLDALIGVDLSDNPLEGDKAQTQLDALRDRRVRVTY